MIVYNFLVIYTIYDSFKRRSTDRPRQKRTKRTYWDWGATGAMGPTGPAGAGISSGATDVVCAIGQVIK